jgi:hypothetical protein
MDDSSDFSREPPRFWIAFGILCITFALAFVMAVYSSVDAHAQQQTTCVLMDKLRDTMARAFHETPIWQGVADTPIGPVESFLFQSANGATWTMVDVVGKDAEGREVGCFVRRGTNGVPNDMGKGI